MSRLWFAPSGIIALLITLGPLLAHLGWVRPDAGFFSFFLGLFLAFAAGISLAAAAAYATTTGKPWRRSALLASVLPLLVAVATFVAVQQGNAPRINDVSTDLAERPAFSAPITVRGQVMLIPLEGVTEVAVEGERLRKAVASREKSIGKLRKAVDNERFAKNNPVLHKSKSAQYQQEKSELEALKLGLDYLPEGA